MNGPTEIPRLERPAFAHGQRLLPDDMEALFDYAREVRWLHNRALHPWGIGAGFAVHGERGTRQVTVEPGYALDCLGRDLILAVPRTLQVPPLAGAPTGGPIEVYLTASYAADDELEIAERRGGECEGGGAVRRVEAPRLRWQNPRDVRDPELRFRRGLDLILAAVQVEDCRLAAAASGALRRSARLAVRPYVAAGRTPAGETAWRFFPAAGRAEGVETTVDTTAAGFQTTPLYTAEVVGSRMLAAAPSGGAGLLATGLVEVADASATGFTLRVHLPRDLEVGAYRVNPDALFVADTLERLREASRWHVDWFGVED